MNSPLKYHGGKRYLANSIVSIMPPHLHYVEPFAGGLSVLLAKSPESVSEVANDLNGHLTRFWRWLQEPMYFNILLRRLQATPFSQVEYDHACRILYPDSNESWPDLDKVWAFFVMCRQSMAGRMINFTPITRNRVRRGMNEQVSAWMNSIECLPEVASRLARVVILNDYAVNVIQSQDGPETLFYLDPPYLHDTRSTTTEYGNFEMTDEDHRDLLMQLSVIQGKFILSGYPSELYTDYANRNDWHLYHFDLPNNSASGKVKERRLECLWTNFDAKVEEPA